MKISSKITLCAAVVMLIFETGYAGPSKPAVIPVIIDLGGEIICNFMCCYSPKGMRKLEDFDRRLIASKCDDLEYDVLLLIDSHLVMALVPSKEAEHSGCKPFLFHAKFDEETKTMNKEVIEVDSTDIVFEGVLETGEHFLSLDKFPLNELTYAFDEAAINAEGHDDSFDIVENNCGDFLAHFLQIIGHKTSDDEMMAITSGLILANPELPNSMREKVVGTSAEALSDRHLVFSVVKNKMSAMLVE